MKKKFIIIILAACTALACKDKNNKNSDELSAESTQLSGHPKDSVLPMPANPNEELIKEAKSKPLTNLTLSENHHDFGKVKKGEKVQHTYEVTNSGKNPLIISHVKPGCGCTAPEFTKDPIMPGNKGKITLSFDSSNFDGIQNKHAEVFANVENTPIVLTFKAEVQP